MASMSITFTSDNADDIACIVAFWDLIQNEQLVADADDEPSMIVLDNFLRLHDIYQSNIDRVYDFMKTWNEEEAESMMRRFPKLEHRDAT